jgi:hypothetical protein
MFEIFGPEEVLSHVPGPHGRKSRLRPVGRGVTDIFNDTVVGAGVLHGKLQEAEGQVLHRLEPVLHLDERVNGVGDLRAALGGEGAQRDRGARQGDQDRSHALLLYK